MSRKIHMQDQVGHHKVEEIMSHYNGYSMEMWGLKILMLAIFLLLGAYW
jgi:hypothetical protein